MSGDNEMNGSVELQISKQHQVNFSKKKLMKKASSIKRQYKSKDSKKLESLNIHQKGNIFKSEEINPKRTKHRK